MQTPLFLGVDGGGTRCRARLCTADKIVLGEGVAGPANIRLGLEAAFTAIKAAALQAVQEAGLSAADLGYIHAGLGLAGVLTAADRAAVATYPHPFANTIYATDAEIACLGAHGGADGAVLVLGTGSVGVIRAAGQMRTFGGWGLAISDQASGAWLGREAVRISLLAAEALLPSSAFTQTVMAHFQNQPENLLIWSEQAKPKDYAEFAPWVFSHADHQDPHAQQILQQALHDIEALLSALAKSGAPQISLLGGLAAVYQALLPVTWRNRLAKPQGDALDGALLLARQQKNSGA